MSDIRPPAVAGSFYPDNPAVLAASIAAMLESAQRHQPPDVDEPLPKAVIVPHAGYIYSGPVAATAFLRLGRGKGIYSRVVLLGPVHRVPVKGLALPSAAFFATPFGEIPVDGAAVRLLAGLHQVAVDKMAHAWEHSLEVQLPFLQLVLGEFSLVPLAVGDASAEAVAQVLDRLWGGPETVIVISSDLSHYLPYDSARRVDEKTVQEVLALRLITDHKQACGATPVNGIITAALRKGLVPRLLDLRNSGDTSGDRGRVVGYASIAFYEEALHD